VQRIRLTDDECLALWNARGDLVVEGFTLLRTRVAIRCVERAWRNHFKGTDRFYYCMKMVQSLDKQRQRGKPHPLHWEIIMVVKEIQRGGRREHIYANLRHVKAKRAIHKVLHGGRKDSAR